jgi:uncharacterized protein YjbI with pentapeptide repeats
VTRVPQWTGFSRKTLWDWLQLLIVPAILVGLTFVWSASQTRSDNRREDRRIAADQAAAEEARRDATLEAYFNKMGSLMLDKKLLASKPSDAVRQVARIVTLTTLHRLDGVRKAAVLRFLYEARFVGSVDIREGNSAIRAWPAGSLDRPRAVVSLEDADFSGADLRGMDLEGVILTGANFEGANLEGAHLNYAFLWRATFKGANLFRSTLGGANLYEANFSRANLSEAFADYVNVQFTNLSGANLRKAHFSNVFLNGTMLTDANLEDIDLYRASFFNTNLRGVVLDNAGLFGVEDLDLARFIADLPPQRRKAFLDAQRRFLDSLPASELAKFNLTRAKLARIRREASGG